MAKLTLNDVGSLINHTTAQAIINQNSAATETAMEKTLSRDGTSPNYMDNVLDMNSNRIINLPAAVFDHEPVRKAEFDDAVFGDIDFGGTSSGITHQYDTDTATTNVRAKLNNNTPLDLKLDFGAVGDGIVNDTAAFQAAGDRAIRDGRELFIPEGTYSISAVSFVIPENSTWSGPKWQGVNSRSVFTARNDGTSAPMVTIRGVPDYFHVAVDSITKGVTTTITTKVPHNLVAGQGFSIVGAEGLANFTDDSYTVGAPVTATTFVVRNISDTVNVDSSGYAGAYVAGGALTPQVGTYFFRGTHLKDLVFDGSTSTDTKPLLDLYGNYFGEFENLMFRQGKGSGTRGQCDVRYGTGVFSFAFIDSVTAANPGVVTTMAAHSLQAGSRIVFEGLEGVENLNGNIYFVLPTGLTATAFQFSATEGGVAINTSAMPAYVGGGTLKQVNPDWSANHDLYFKNCRWERIAGTGFQDADVLATAGCVFQDCQFIFCGAGGVSIQSTNFVFHSTSFAFCGFNDFGVVSTDGTGATVGSTRSGAVQNSRFHNCEFDGNSGYQLYYIAASSSRVDGCRFIVRDMVQAAITNIAWDGAQLIVTADRPHQLTTGRYVKIVVDPANLGGMVEVLTGNGFGSNVYHVTNLTSTTFRLNQITFGTPNVNGAAFTPYISGGTIYSPAPYKRMLGLDGNFGNVKNVHTNGSLIRYDTNMCAIGSVGAGPGGFVTMDNFTLGTVTDMNCRGVLEFHNFQDVVGNVDMDAAVAITAANPAVFTTDTEHGLRANDWVTLENLEGLTQLNGNKYRVSSFGLTADQFTLVFPSTAQFVKTNGAHAGAHTVGTGRVRRIPMVYGTFFSGTVGAVPASIARDLSIIMDDGTVLLPGKSVYNKGGLRQFLVAEAPLLGSNEYELAYVPDGDGANACLAVWDGNTWRRFALGATIT